MINLKLVVISTRPKKNGECPILIQIPKNQKTIWINTGLSVMPNNFRQGRVQGGNDKDPHAKAKNQKLAEIMKAHEDRLWEYEDQVDFMSLNDIKELLVSKSPRRNTDFFSYTEKQLKELQAHKKKGTYVPLKYTLDNVRAFWDRPNLDFSQINRKFLMRFDQYCLDNNRSRNTIALFFRYIRSMFNDAIDEYNGDTSKPIILNYPFRTFKIETEATLNRNLSFDTLRKILYWTPQTKRQLIALDIFTLQILLFGINMKDLFYLRHENIVDGRLQYKRFKTSRQYNIKLEPEALILLEKYRGENFLLWFADTSLIPRAKGTKRHSRAKDMQYANHSNFLDMINLNLQKIQEEIELTLATNLTTHFSKHTFSTLMRELKISKDDISLCLGHRPPERSMKTSNIYINEDWLPADQANRKLINHIWGLPEKKKGKAT